MASYRVAVFFPGDGLVGYLDRRRYAVEAGKAAKLGTEAHARLYGEEYCGKVKYSRYEIERVETVVETVASGSHRELTR